jgi:hypothetical protein
VTRRGWLLFIALSLCWGIPYLFIRVAVVDLDPLIVAFGRTAIGGLLLLPLALRARALQQLRPHWKILLLYTAVEIIGPWILLGHAETRLNSSTTGLIIAVVPIAAAIILTVMGLDRLDIRRISGLVIGFVGVGLLVGLDVQIDDFVAIGQLLLVVLGYAIGPIIIIVDRGRGVRAIYSDGLAGSLDGAGAWLGRSARGYLHCHGVPGDVRSDCRSWTGQDDSDHLRQPGRRHTPRGNRVERASHHRPRHRIPADHCRFGAGHLAEYSSNTRVGRYRRRATAERRR